MAEYYTYQDPVRDDAMTHRRQQRIQGPAAWSADHGGACPMCGSHDGWRYLTREDLQAQPPQPDETFYRDNDEDNDIVYLPCPSCSTDYTDMVAMSHQEVKDWLHNATGTIHYDDELMQYVGVALDGHEVYGFSYIGCWKRLREVNATIAKHRAENREGRQ